MASLAGKLRGDEQVIGLIPTMGSLHEGHLSLIRKARQLCQVVIVSIFVNPEQFNESSDFDNYPRDLTADSALLAGMNVDFIFAPSAEEIYGENYNTFVTVDELSEKLEGASRPGHFRGVSTIVTILFNTIRPDIAFFGQKDAQQVAIIKRLTNDLGFETQIAEMPIVREENGLALSSRNERLSPEQREAAGVIYAALQKAEEMAASGESNAPRITEMVRETIENEPSAKIDYVAAVDSKTLEPVESISEGTVMIAVAVYFDDIRLIDNVVFGEKQ